ncbi:hypothetical protein CCHR01_16306 [Colletotrichum chrysophilum]|uniref:Uncharacterized protein n=1 Tax=Colletotrichum chrysophilum TaxID=1836956 RepID=A0AAD9A442_9PEZI|nr:hypothetical protein CCHR01_16306 [Colletotrichum chrysophilum]
MKLEPRKGRGSEHAGSRPTNLGLPPFSALGLWDTYLTEQVPRRRAFLLFLRAGDEKETVAADAAAAVPGLGHLSNLHNNSRPMWASSTSYCKLPFFRLHTFHFWKGGLVTLNPGRRRAGRLGGGRSPRLCDLESLGSLRRSGDGKVYQTQSQSETTGKAADLPRLAESTKHDTFDVDFRRSRAVDVDLDVVLVVGKLQPGRWGEAWRGTRRARTPRRQPRPRHLPCPHSAMPRALPAACQCHAMCLIRA